MLKIVPSNRFKRDLKQAVRRHFNLDSLNAVVTMLAEQKELPPKYRDHALSGGYSGFRECHIQPNWLLVYRIEDLELELYLFRTGTHSDLF